MSESDDRMLSNDQMDSPLIDEGNSGGSSSGGGGVVLKKGPWTSAEDAILVEYVKKHGEGNWNAVQKHSGLFRCGKSCRLRWANHLRPNLKKGTFTPDEELTIVKLHAKLGNKWARMAAHLPGRTDNEIKNYWNTRVKRRQRAGLPLYPPDFNLHAMQESQQNLDSGGINSVDKGQHDLLQSNSSEIPDVIFQSYGNRGILSYVPEYDDISPSTTLMKGLGSTPQYGFIPSGTHGQKRLREPPPTQFSFFGDGIQLFDHTQDNMYNKLSRSFGLSFPYDPDPSVKNLLSFGVSPGSHSLMNGNFCASKQLTNSGAAKPELPSLQYPETDLGSWGTSSTPPPLLESADGFIQTPPPTGTFQSDECESLRNSGLLEALIHEATTLRSAATAKKNRSSDKSSNSSTISPADASTMNICETEWEGHSDPISPPAANSTTSLFSEHTTISPSISCLEEHPPADTFPGECSVKSEPIEHMWNAAEGEEKKTVCELDMARPDAMLAGGDWSPEHGSSNALAKEAEASIESYLDDDYYKRSSQRWEGLDSCTWNNLPPL